MNAPLIAAGTLALIGSAVHGMGGEVLVVRELSPAQLPPTRFGGPRATKSMIHVTWHIATVAFLAVGSALLLSGTVLHGDAAPAVGMLAAGAATGFAAVAIALGGVVRSPRSLLVNPGPALLAATAALAWWGSLQV